MFLRKIFIHDRPLVLATKRTEVLRTHPEVKNYTHFEGAFPKHIRQAIELLQDEDVPGVLITDLLPENLLAEIDKRYKQIDAAGGLVRNEADEFLFIFRRGKWDLPKGKLDKGELIDECAVREVQEETGLKRLVLGDFLCDTYHTYRQGGKDLIKRTAWYAMRASGYETLLPQIEEDIEEVRWVSEAEANRLALKTYGAIGEVLRCGQAILK